MIDVFISYSRRNIDFVRKLDAALATQGKTTWFAQKKEPFEGIPPGSRWWDEIQHGIQEANNFLFVISPASIASPYCNAEIAYALQQEKRLVTVLYSRETKEATTLQAIDAAIDAIPKTSELPSSVSASISNLRSLTRRNWLKIGQVQYILFSADGQFEQSLELLIRGLDTDMTWLRTWSQVRQTAQIWAETGDSSYLWSELRLRPIREEVERRNQHLTDIEHDFLRPEQARLVAELEDINTTHQRRSAIGERLALIGDTRQGVGLRSTDNLPDIMWCYVPGGDIMLEHEGKFLVQPFYMAKYHITYKQFQSFLNDKKTGIDNFRWWDGLSAEAWMLKMKEQDLKYPNYPRTMVNWYQAVAFCRWLSDRLPPNGRPDGVSEHWLIRLPTEWEWQQAATGGQPENECPWAEWDDRLANTQKAGILRTMAVGMYPAGTWKDGPLDLVGNVMEWCLNEAVNSWEVSTYGNLSRALRGGSHSSADFGDRSVVRGHLNPRHGNPDIGFRVVLGSSL